MSKVNGFDFFRRLRNEDQNLKVYLKTIGSSGDFLKIMICAFSQTIEHNRIGMNSQGECR
jgi:hypothetical protein